MIDVAGYAKDVICSCLNCLHIKSKKNQWIEYVKKHTDEIGSWNQDDYDVFKMGIFHLIDNYNMSDKMKLNEMPKAAMNKTKMCQQDALNNALDLLIKNDCNGIYIRKLFQNLYEKANGETRTNFEIFACCLIHAILKNHENYDVLLSEILKEVEKQESTNMIVSDFGTRLGICLLTVCYYNISKNPSDKRKLDLTRHVNPWITDEFVEARSSIEKKHKIHEIISSVYKHLGLTETPEYDVVNSLYYFWERCAHV